MKNVLEFIEGSVAKYPDKLAVADVNGGLTYKELEKAAKQVGAWLYQGLGGCKNRPVVVLLDKEPKSVAAFMGAVYSGNFYVVIDAEMPVDRVNKILKALKPEAAITDNKHLDKAKELHVETEDGKGYAPKIFNLDEMDQEADQSCLAKVRANMIDTDPVYALFTSGSTGVPRVRLYHMQIFFLILHGIQKPLISTRQQYLEIRPHFILVCLFQIYIAH